MKNEKRTREQVVVVTGNTVESLKAKAEGREYEGSESSRRCYLCRRADGEHSVAVDVVNDELVGRKIELDEFVTEIGGTLFAFHLCFECRILLNAVSENVSRKAAHVVAPSEN